jgi:hypothetical protein
MKLNFCAALLALSIGSIGIAWAGEGEAPIANSSFTVLPGVIAEAAVQNGQAVATTSSGTMVYTTQQRTDSAFPWNPNQGVGG